MRRSVFRNSRQLLLTVAITLASAVWSVAPAQALPAYQVIAMSGWDKAIVGNKYQLLAHAIVVDRQHQTARYCTISLIELQQGHANTQGWMPSSSSCESFAAPADLVRSAADAPSAPSSWQIAFPDFWLVNEQTGELRFCIEATLDTRPKARDELECFRLPFRNSSDKFVGPQQLP